jgi:Fe2+ transport system protein B
VVNLVGVIRRRLQQGELSSAGLVALVVAVLFALTCVSAIALGELGHAVWTAAVTLCATAVARHQERPPDNR